MWIIIIETKSEKMSLLDLAGMATGNLQILPHDPSSPSCGRWPAQCPPHRVINYHHVPSVFPWDLKLIIHLVEYRIASRLN
jgi:hypothetical protein